MAGNHRPPSPRAPSAPQFARLLRDASDVDDLRRMLIELMLSEAWERVKSRYRKPDPTWAEVAIRGLEPRLGRSFSPAERLGVAGWMQRTDVFSVLAATTTESLAADAERVVASLESEFGPPSDENRKLAAELVKLIIAHITEIADPGIAATLATHRSIMAGVQQLKLGQDFLYSNAIENADRILEAIESVKRPPGLDPLLERLPVVVSRHIHDATDAGQNGATLLEWLSDIDQIHKRLVTLVSRPPQWLTDAGHLWAAVGYMCDAVALESEAIQSFRLAADYLPSQRCGLLISAGLAASRIDDTEGAVALFDLASEVATTADELLLAVVRAGVANDVQAMVAAAESALAQGSSDDVLVRTWLGRARSTAGSLDAAIEVFEGAGDGIDRYAGFLICHAEARIRRAFDDTGKTRIADAKRALELALTARDLRRDWGGRSEDAALIACQAALCLEELDLVIRLGSFVEGDATEEEAACGEVRQLLTIARVMRDGGAPEPHGEFERAWVSGLTLGRDPAAQGEAIVELCKAVEIAANDAELDRAQRSLAMLGCLDIPRLGELRDRDPDHAEVVVAIAEMNSGKSAEAIRRLRPLAGRSRLAAHQLSEAYEVNGSPSEAARVLAEGGERFNDARMLAQAARHFLDLGRSAQFAQCADRALVLSPLGSETRREIRGLQVNAAMADKDLTAVETAARTALAEGESRDGMRWVLVEALALQGRVGDAWQQVRSNPVMLPDDENRADLYLKLLMRVEPDRLELLEEVLGLFPDSHDVTAVGLSMFFAFSSDEPRDLEYVSLLQARAEKFVERYPDSPILRSMAISVDDPERLREQMREMIKPDPERDRQAKLLYEMAVVGRLPYAFFASLFGRSCLDALLNGETLGFTSVSFDPSVLNTEMDTALSTLDQGVVVDPSSLAALSIDPPAWPAVLSAFSSIVIADAVAIEIQDRSRRKQASGAFRWDHERDIWIAIASSPAQIEAERAQLALIAGWASELQVVPAGKDEVISDLEGGREGNNWVASLATAKESGVPLLCDDVALGMLARSMGVPTFGSFALRVALVKGNRAAGADLDDALGALFDAHATDLPLSPAQLTYLARSRGWPLSASIYPLTRPFYWRDVQAARSGYIATMEGLGSGVEAISSALYGACIGVVRTIAFGTPLPLLSLLFVDAVLCAALDPAAVPRLLGAIRSVCSTYDLADPLDACVTVLMEMAAESKGEASAATFVSALLVELPVEDRVRSASVILDSKR